MSSLCDVINIICFECCIKFSDIFDRVKIYMHTYFYIDFRDCFNIFVIETCICHPSHLVFHQKNVLLPCLRYCQAEFLFTVIFQSYMFVEYSFRGIPLVVFIEHQQKILFLASVLINPDILMFVMMGYLMDSYLYPVSN